MTVSASIVQELRKRTGAGMMECKKALVAVDGDIDKAIEAMRKSGQTKADKKSGRIAADGIIMIKVNAAANEAIILEINSETDFVARDDNFKAFADNAAQVALDNKVTNVEELSKQPFPNTSDTVEEARQNIISKLGENIKLRRLELVKTDAKIGFYIHSGRIGVVVTLKGGDADLAKDIAMHIAASHPIVVRPEDVPAEAVAKEREIFEAQAATSGKPANIIEKMVAGRINKFLDEVSLLGQPFVKDPSLTIAQLAKNANAEVIAFTRFAVGEGIEKKVENFAEEVMSQIQASE